MKIRVVDYNTGEENTYLGVTSIIPVNAEQISINGLQTILYVNPKEKFIIIEEA